MSWLEWLRARYMQQANHSLFSISFLFLMGKEIERKGLSEGHCCRERNMKSETFQWSEGHSVILICLVFSSFSFCGLGAAGCRNAPRKEEDRRKKPN